MDSLCRIVLADDHKLLMEGVRSLLAPYPELRVEGMAADGEEAVALAASLAPHLLIMDLSMPRMAGVEAALATREVSPRTRVIIYTGHEDGRRLRERIYDRCPQERASSRAAGCHRLRAAGGNLSGSLRSRRHYGGDAAP